MKFISGLFVFCLAAISAGAQTFILSGKITNDRGDAVPFASVYLQNTSTGTSANSEGDYKLRLAAGTYNLVFKAIGFNQQNQRITLSTNQELNVRLQTQVYALSEVAISADAEDPAYAIMRKAIENRKRHLNETGNYTTDVYIKGLQRLLAAPKKFLGRDIEKIGQEIGLDSNRQGIIYLSESESKLSFMQPDNYREEMISSKVSGSNRAFSFNRASDIKVNLYENYQDWEGLSNRPIISPLAENALFYYRYKYLGSALENGFTINKIQVIPRRNADPVFRGSIYIIEDSWRLHSLNLMLTKEANINFVDTLQINQQFIPVGQKIWMPSSVKFDFTGGFLGFRFGGYFLAIYKNYDLNPSLNAKDFDEVLLITKQVNKKDSAYWAQARPVPLTGEETNDYRKKETLAAKRESKPYLDSLDQVNNQFKPLAFIIGSGYNPRNRFRKEFYRFSSVRNAVFYNTVEGFGLNYEASYNKKIDSLSNQFVSLTGKLRYGFSSNKLYGTISGSKPLGETNFNFSLGSDVLDLNNLGTISPLGNTINSLFYERNFMKLYEKKFAQASVSRRISTGLITSVSAELASRTSLENTSDFTFIDNQERQFTANNPLTPLTERELFPENQSVRIGLRATYEFGKKYATYPTGRVYQPSAYPKFGLTFTKSFANLFGSDTDFSFLSVDVSKADISVGLYGKSSFWLGAGKFLNANQLFFPDFKHFIGTQSLSYTPKINTFLFLDYYRFGTADQFFEGHFEHNFSGFISNKLPLIRKLKLQEIAGVNYLSTPVLKRYTEIYAGLQYLNFRVLYGASYREDKQTDQGFRIAYGF